MSTPGGADTTMSHAVICPVLHTVSALNTMWLGVPNAYVIGAEGLWPRPKHLPPEHSSSDVMLAVAHDASTGRPRAPRK